MPKPSTKQTLKRKVPVVDLSEGNEAEGETYNQEKRRETKEARKAEEKDNGERSTDGNFEQTHAAEPSDSRNLNGNSNSSAGESAKAIFESCGSSKSPQRPSITAGQISKMKTLDFTAKQLDHQDLPELCLKIHDRTSIVVKVNEAKAKSGASWKYPGFNFCRESTEENGKPFVFALHVNVLPSAIKALREVERYLVNPAKYMNELDEADEEEEPEK